MMTCDARSLKCSLMRCVRALLRMTHSLRAGSKAAMVITLVWQDRSRGDRSP